MEDKKEDEVKRRAAGSRAFSSLGGLAWTIYFFICIDSLYKDIEEEKFPGVVKQLAFSAENCSNTNRNYQTPQSMSIQVDPRPNEKF